MDIILNEKLRALRRGRDLTQGELAEKLNVSVQAVSKWERGEGYPDITMLPQIAAFFDVSIDELMGMEECRVTEKIKAYEKESHTYCNRGEIEKDLALWERVHAEFPNNISVSYFLLQALYTNQAYERAVSLGEELWNDPKLGEARSAVAQKLCFSYNRLGNKEMAKKYANSMGDMYTTRPELLIHVLEGEEAVELAQSNVLNHLELMRINIYRLCRNGEFSAELRLRIWKASLSLYETVFEDGDYGFYACRMADIYWEIGVAYLNLNDIPNALDAIEQRAKFVIQYDTRGVSQHTSPLINTMTDDPTDSTKNYAHNDSHQALRLLKNKIYDPIREEPRFKAVIEELTKYAK